jgi:hypothetical protein
MAFFLSFFDVHLHCVLADVRDAWGEDWRRWVSFRDRELGSVCLQRLKMDSAWERSSLGDDIKCDIRGSKGVAGAESLSSLFLSLSLSQEGNEESMETLTMNTSISEGEVPDLANSFATLSSLSTTTQLGRRSIGGRG